MYFPLQCVDAPGQEASPGEKKARRILDSEAEEIERMSQAGGTVLIFNVYFYIKQRQQAPSVNASALLSVNLYRF